MNTKDRVVSIDVSLTTADECTNNWRYEVDANGNLGPQVDLGWTGDPELETDYVAITLNRESGTTDHIEITGDDHRDIENGDGYEIFLTKLVAGVDPEVLLDKAAAESLLNETPRSRPMRLK